MKNRWCAGGDQWSKIKSKRKHQLFLYLGKYWCSTEVDAFGNHVNKAGNLGFCGFCENPACGCGCNAAGKNIGVVHNSNNKVNNDDGKTNAGTKIEKDTTETMPIAADVDDFDIRNIE